MYYDGDIFGVRLAYNTRSSFLRNIGGGSDIRSNVTYTDGFDRLDVRVNFEVTNFFLIRGTTSSSSKPL